MQTCISVFLMLGKSANFNHGSDYSLLPTVCIALSGVLWYYINGDDMELKFKNGKFRILMIADTQEGRNVSSDTMKLIEASLDRAEPDMVVYSGDQIWGKRSFKGDKNEVRRVLKELTQPVVDRKIPFAVCFGNHDR